MSYDTLLTTQASHWGSWFYNQQLSIFMDLDDGFKIVSTLEFIVFELRDGVVLLNVCLLYEGNVLSASL